MKKIITLAIVSAMLLAMTACGDKTENEGTGTTAAQTTVETTADTTLETTTAAQTEADGTVGEILLADFKTKATGTAQEIADGLLQNPALQFMPASMPVEPGFLTGFDNVEIKDFKEGVMFGPAIGTIPFVGYIFILEDGADVDAFKTTLKDNANLRWNICVTADEIVCENEGNTVFFLMCPTSFEEPEMGNDAGIGDMGVGDMGVGDMGVGDMGVGDMDMPAADGIPAEDGIVLE